MNKCNEEEENCKNETIKRASLLQAVTCFRDNMPYDFYGMNVRDCRTKPNKITKDQICHYVGCKLEHQTKRPTFKVHASLM